MWLVTCCGGVFCASVVLLCFSATVRLLTPLILTVLEDQKQKGSFTMARTDEDRKAEVGTWAGNFHSRIYLTLQDSKRMKPERMKMYRVPDQVRLVVFVEGNPKEVLIDEVLDKVTFKSGSTGYSFVEGDLRFVEVSSGEWANVATFWQKSIDKKAKAAPAPETETEESEGDGDNG